MRKLKNKSKKLIFLLCLSFFCLLGVVSCNYGFFWGLFGEENVDERSSSLSSLQSASPNFSAQTEIDSSGSVYSGLVITDLHYGASWGDNNEQDFLDWFENRIETCKESNPEKIPRFIVNLGDTADGGHKSEFSDYLNFENRIKSLAKKKLGDADYKIYSILGNHDLYNNGVEHYDDFCYPYISSYYFAIGGFGYYFLDTANGTLGENQLEDFKDRISADPRPKIVFTHYPIYAGAGNEKYILMRLQNTMERNTLLTYFSKYNVKQVYEGHIHARTWFDFKKFREDVIDSFRYGQAAVFTVNEEAGTVSTEIIEF